MKKLFLGAMAFLVAVTLVACGSKKDADESIKENKKLVVAVSPDYPPFEFKTLVDGKDQVVGSDIKLAQAIANELGVKLEVTTMSFDNVLSSLQSGKADLAISGISVTDERKKTFDFSDPYYETQNAIIVRKDQESTYSSLDALKGKKVAVHPLAKPAIATVFIIDFLNTWNEFMVQSVLITNDSMKTVPNGLLSFFGEFTVDYGLLNAGVLITIIPVLLVYLLFQKYFVNGMAGAVKG